MSKLVNFYRKEIINFFINKKICKNVMQVPKLDKIVVNIGLGKNGEDKVILKRSLDDISLITGQKAIITKARKSISSFKIREGWNMGCKVTLRGIRMYEFFDRLLSIVIPCIRDFRGFSCKSFDGHGNYSLGLKEQIVFPEISYDRVDFLQGLDIIIVTTANDNYGGYMLLKAFKFPFKDSISV